MSLTIVGIGLLQCLSQCLYTYIDIDLSVRERRGVCLLWVRVTCLGSRERWGGACGGGERCEAVFCRTVGVHAGIVQGG